MAEKTGDKIDLRTVTYVIGILSIVFAFVNPIAGLILGIIGIVQSKKQNFPKAKKLNTIGVVISVIFIVILIIVSIYAASKGIDTSGSFPRF